MISGWEKGEVQSTDLVFSVALFSETFHSAPHIKEESTLISHQTQLAEAAHPAVVSTYRQEL